VTFSCVIDGVALPCASPFTWPQQLADGDHSLQVSGTDLGGRTSASSLVSFRIDTTAPQTKIVAHPRKRLVTRTRARAVFRFSSSEGGADFLCKVDKAAYKQCGKRLVKRFKVGKHVLRVKASDAAGNVDPSPAVFRFRVVRAR
jgi:large repetitive protein